MISTTVAFVTLVLVLAGFVAVALGAGRTTDSDRYLTARGSQSVGRLSLAFLASALGSWILFAPPEVGQSDAAVLGVFGYALGAALPFVAYAWLGPRIRAATPGGVTLSDWVRGQFGRPAQVWVSLVSIFYMFMFVTAELTAIGGVLDLLSGLDPWVGIVMVAAVTAGYTAYGGLPASLRTDQVQSLMIVGLVVVVIGAIFVDVGEPLATAEDGGLTTFTRSGWESIIVLSIAIVAANLFHQGYWQRTWSAADNRVLVRAGIAGAVLSFLVLLPFGATGLITRGISVQDGTELSPVPFFSLVAGLPDPIVLLVIVMAVALVASSVDSLQSALAAVLAEDLSDRRLSVRATRAGRVLLTIPAVLIALNGYDVLRLFLIADLVAAATVVPVFLGLRRPSSSASVVAGSIAGLASVFVLGWIQGGSPGDGIDLLTVASSPDLDLGSFVIAPLASGAVALALTHTHTIRSGSRSARQGV